jgi:RNA polymerase sigma-70 factor (ECF subfamily)
MATVKCSDVNEYEETSSTLLRQARSQDPEAWDRLVQTYSRPIYRWCRRAGLQPADASNVVQEVLRAVARKLCEFRREEPGDSFRGWLRRIAQNKMRDHWRASQRRVDAARGGSDAHDWLMQLPNLPEPLTATHTAAVTGTASDLQRMISQVRGSCSDRDWLFFWRIVVDGQSASEVAQEFGVTANAVRLVKMRVLRKMREAVADCR